MKEPIEQPAAMTSSTPRKELPSRIPTMIRSPAVAPVVQTAARPASKSLTSSSPRPPTTEAAPPVPSRPASRSVTTRPTTSSAASATKAASLAATATPTRPASRSVNRAPAASTASLPVLAVTRPVTRPVSRSTSRSVTSSSSTVSTSATPRTKATASPATRPVSRSVTKPAAATAATTRRTAPNTKATSSPAPNKKAAATRSAAASPLTLAAAATDAIPAPLSLPPPAADSSSSNADDTSSVIEAARLASAAAVATLVDLPPPTDPSVPVYHAPHYSQAVHHAANGRKRSSLIQPVGSLPVTTAAELEAKVNEWREEYLAMSIEEVADWLQRVLSDKPLTDYISAVGRRETLDKEKTEAAHRVSLSISHPLLPPPSPLFDALQTGVLLCQLALAIDTSLSVRYKPTAAVGSFFARDNINSFLDAALSWGVLRSQLFEVDDLVMRKNDRGVVNSLLDITRVVYIRFPHVLPPQLVQFELEIAALEAQPPPPPPPPPLQPVPTPPTPPAVVEPAEPAKPRGPRYLPYIADETDPLDVAVGRIVNGHQLDTLVKRVVKGQYWIAEEKVHHLRLVRHLVLVRVGGGWEGLLPMTSRKILEGVGESDGSDGAVSPSM